MMLTFLLGLQCLMPTTGEHFRTGTHWRHNIAGSGSVTYDDPYVTYDALHVSYDGGNV